MAINVLINSDIKAVVASSFTDAIKLSQNKNFYLDFFQNNLSLGKFAELSRL